VLAGPSQPASEASRESTEVDEDWTPQTGGKTCPKNDNDDDAMNTAPAQTEWKLQMPCKFTITIHNHNSLRVQLS